jgi:hypothetical protein
MKFWIDFAGIKHESLNISYVILALPLDGLNFIAVLDSKELYLLETLHNEQLVEETVTKSSYVDNNNLKYCLFEPKYSPTVYNYEFIF